MLLSTPRAKRTQDYATGCSPGHSSPCLSPCPLCLSLSPLLPGWAVDEASTEGINPEVLISLTAPKKCAASFTGKHFLAGRYLPYDIQKKYDLNLPEYPGTDCLIEL